MFVYYCGPLAGSLESVFWSALILPLVAGWGRMSGRKRRQRPSSAANPRSDAPRKAGDPVRPRPPLTRRRRWLFRLTAAVVSLLLFFVLLEVGLRLGGYGYPTGFLVGPDAKGFYRGNLQFGWRFFPRRACSRPRAVSAVGESRRHASHLRAWRVGGAGRSQLVVQRWPDTGSAAP